MGTKRHFIEKVKSHVSAKKRSNVVCIFVGYFTQEAGGGVKPFSVFLYFNLPMSQTVKMFENIVICSIFTQTLHEHTVFKCHSIL